MSLSWNLEVGGYWVFQNSILSISTGRQARTWLHSQHMAANTKSNTEVQYLFFLFVVFFFWNEWKNYARSLTDFDNYFLDQREVSDPCDHVSVFTLFEDCRMFSHTTPLCYGAKNCRCLWSRLLPQLENKTYQYILNITKGISVQFPCSIVPVMCEQSFSLLLFCSVPCLFLCETLPSSTTTNVQKRLKLLLIKFCNYLVGWEKKNWDTP